MPRRGTPPKRCAAAARGAFAPLLWRAAARRTLRGRPCCPPKRRKTFTNAEKYGTIVQNTARVRVAAGGTELARFSGGVHPAGCKRTAGGGIGVCPAPARVYLPLARHIGKPALPVVEAGRRVRRGELVAAADGRLSANVYASVAGVVTGVVTHIEGSGKKAPHVLIENDFSDESVQLAPLAERTPESVLARIAEAGIVGMGGAGFPTAVKLDAGGRADVLVVNGAECEPYITCDDSLMRAYTVELVQGIRLAMLACGARRAVVGIEKNKPQAIAALQAFCGQDIEVRPLRTRYPQGAEKQLIYGCTGRVVPEGKLPADAGAVVVNVHTALSIYKAVEENEPCSSRVMTVSGGACARPQDLWVPNGTPLRDLAEHCGGREDCARIVLGGPMMGEPVFSLKVCTGKTTSCLLFLDESECRERPVGPCIGCGRCVQACPMGLMPVFIEEALFAKDLDGAARYGAPACIACGCCSYVCPAARQLAPSVKLAKKLLRERKI